MKLSSKILLASVAAAAFMADGIASRKHHDGHRRNLPPMSENVKEALSKMNPDSYKVYGVHGQANQNVKQGPSDGLSGSLEKPKVPGSFAWTFDDGPFDFHNEVVDNAAKLKVPITFFVNVKNFDCIYNQKRVEAMKYSYEKGATICSHTATHPHLNNLTNEQIDVEIQETEDALFKILGVVPRCIRPPYGEADERVIKHLNERWGLLVVNWTIDAGDAIGKTPQESLEIIRGIKAPNATNLLSHETHQTTAEQVFPEGVPMLFKNGYKVSDFKTINDAFQFNPYKVVAKPGKRDSTWNCDSIKNFSMSDDGSSNNKSSNSSQGGVTGSDNQGSESSSDNQGSESSSDTQSSKSGSETENSDAKGDKGISDGQGSQSGSDDQGSDAKGSKSGSDAQGSDTKGAESSSDTQGSDMQGGKSSSDAQGSDASDAKSSSDAKGSETKGAESSSAAQGSDTQGSKSSTDAHSSDASDGKTNTDAQGSDAQQGGKSSGDAQGSSHSSSA